MLKVVFKCLKAGVPRNNSCIVGSLVQFPALVPQMACVASALRGFSSVSSAPSQGGESASYQNKGAQPSSTPEKPVKDATQNLLRIEEDKTTGITTIIMGRRPVNSLNLELLTEINIALEKIENERTCRALVLGSSMSSVFSAGLDINEMYKPHPERIKEFWRTFQETWLRLYGSPLATIAAINGHAPAGGCLLALCCDYRIMANGKFLIGLNETLLGIVAPFWMADTLVNTIGLRESEKALQLGTLYNPSEAASIKLVDQLCDQSEVLPNAYKELQNYLQVPDHARQITKSALRKPTLDKLLKSRKEDIDNFAKFVQRDSIQQSIAKYMESLQKREK